LLLYIDLTESIFCALGYRDPICPGNGRDRLAELRSANLAYCLLA
jgi:hypothetical protein